MENKNEVFGKRLKKLRNQVGKSQEDIANNIGISRARYSHYENNHVEPDLDLIRKLADCFKVSSDYLLGRTDNPSMEQEGKKSSIIERMIEEFPDADLMFNDLSNMTTEQLEEVYEFIKFKLHKRGD